MNFSWWFPYKIAAGKGKKKNLSRVTILIGQITVAIGIVVGIISIGTGIGARKGIKQKLSDFEGHIVITKYENNETFDLGPINDDFALEIPKFDSRIAHVQSFATKSGIIRTEKDVEGIVFKGISKDFDAERFDKFLTKGRLPKIISGSLSNEVVVARKIAKRLSLDVGDDFVAVFPKTDQEDAYYRKFKIVGLFATDIHFLDGLFVIGDLAQIQRMNKWTPHQISGFDVFLKDVEDMDEVAPLVYEKLPPELYAESALNKYQAIRKWISFFDVNIIIIIGLMMIVIIFNISMVFLIIIIERTNSIGILKAMGANNWTIMRVFINYALFIMLPGIIAGNIIGIGLLFLQHQFGIIQLDPDLYYVKTAPVYFNFLYFIILSLGCLLISAVALLLPALRVAKIQPAEAIRFK